jgi:hypothetical protein
MYLRLSFFTCTCFVTMATPRHSSTHGAGTIAQVLFFLSGLDDGGRRTLLYVLRITYFDAILSGLV